MSSIHRQQTPQKKIKKERSHKPVGIAKGEVRRINENFKKRKENFLANGNEISWLYETDVYIALRRKGKCDIFTTSDSSTWPPRKEDIVSL